MTNHIMVTGTGRAGTSFLIHLLTELGYDTGYKPGEIILHPDSRAGLEHDMRTLDPLPYIIKDPNFCDYCDNIFRSQRYKIDRVVIPVRDLFCAAESRKKIHELNQKINPDKATHGGGLLNTKNPEHQSGALAFMLYRLVETCAKHNIPMVFIAYPRMVQDPSYLWAKVLECGFSQNFIGSSQFFEIFDKVVNPDWIK